MARHVSHLLARHVAHLLAQLLARLLAQLLSWLGLCPLELPCTHAMERYPCQYWPRFGEAIGEPKTEPGQ